MQDEELDALTGSSSVDTVENGAAETGRGDHDEGPARGPLAVNRWSAGWV
jgi:hypothetical protein